MKTTAYRLPDPFSPGAADATAATPTCCCCCCCCLATAVTTPIVLHGGLRRDLAAAGPGTPQQERNRVSAPALTVVVWFLLMSAIVVTVFAGGFAADLWPVAIGGFALAALGGVYAIGRWAGAANPAANAGRLALGIVAFGLEFFAGIYLVLLYGSYVVIGPVAALIGAVIAVRAYRR
ncbi:hypothetical protein [Actinokineospora sp.]|uniref:hypothetical protein n=1 Tax=Actinokineospora sp. TaxID=1872133 RepID=UPI0040376D95